MASRPRRELVVRTERHVHVRDAGFVVGVQVVRRVEQRDDVGEAVDVEPDQLFLAPHLAVVAREAAGPFARAETVLDHPREVARLQALGPPSSKPAGTHATVLFHHIEELDRPARRRRRRARARPRHLVRSTTPSLPASRLRARPDRRRRRDAPRNDLRDVPTSNGTPARAASSGSAAQQREVVFRRSSRSRFRGRRAGASDRRPRRARLRRGLATRRRRRLTGSS